MHSQRAGQQQLDQPPVRDLFAQLVEQPVHALVTLAQASGSPVSSHRRPIAGRRRLILHDHLTRPLTLHDITELHLQSASAQLAYLSACSTIDGSPLQVDESTQLTAAFQLAGYRNVIGTLWPISDQTAAVVARDVYAHLTDDGATRPVLESVAEALHRATRKQRERTPVLPTRWAAYVHYGV